MKLSDRIKAFFGFPPTTPPSGAVLGEASPSPREALRNYVRAPKKQRRDGSYHRAAPTSYVPPVHEDHTIRDVAIGVAVGAALSHVPHHSDDASSSYTPSSSDSDSSSSSSSDSFSSGGGDFGGGGSSDSFD